jgi:uncharacterized protein (DUF3820 family)
MTADTPESKIIPFGKYKGRLVEEVLVDDPEWLAGQDWFRAKFNILHQVIINRGAESEETPDHNAMQVRQAIADDYPAVLRQMKANESMILFVGEYRGQGASQEQFVKTMATAGIRVVFACDVGPP